MKLSMQRIFVTLFSVLLSALVLPLRIYAQSAPPADPNITYPMPVWPGIEAATPGEIATQIGILRDTNRIGEGLRVKVGFTTYIAFSMTQWNVNPTNQAAIRSAMTGTIAEIDAK